MNKMRKLAWVAIIAALGLSFPGCASPSEELKVTVSGRQLLLNGNDYEIKGICYHPVPRGKVTRSFDRLEVDLQLMQEAGINTIRLYAPVPEREILDQVHQAGLKIIMGFGYNQGGTYDILSGTFINYVDQFKDHPAILIWELGNEYNYHPEWFEDNIDNWYIALNNAAEQIHNADPNRPVSTAHGEIPSPEILEACPAIDIWGLNVYRWDDPGSIFSEWKEISGKPMYLSEAGADSYMTVAARGYAQGPNEKAQADATKKILEEVFRNLDVCSGVTVFSFLDGLWKAGHPERQDPGGMAPNSAGVPYDATPNEEYWGILDIDRNKKAAFQVVKDIYHSY
jgi:exo-beta-1,3-glucanase (GH17 family)